MRNNIHRYKGNRFLKNHVKQTLKIASLFADISIYFWVSVFRAACFTLRCNLASSFQCQYVTLRWNQQWWMLSLFSNKQKVHAETTKIPCKYISEYSSTKFPFQHILQPHCVTLKRLKWNDISDQGFPAWFPSWSVSALFKWKKENT